MKLGNGQNTKKVTLLKAIWHMRCPRCRQGSMFIHKSIFPLSKLFQMPEECAVCGQRMELGPGFYFGTGYVSYALCLVISAVLLALYILILGFDISDNSQYKFLALDIGLLFLLFPFLIRYSRVIYLYIFVRYNPQKNDTTHSN